MVNIEQTDRLIKFLPAISPAWMAGWMLDSLKRNLVGILKPLTASLSSYMAATRPSFVFSWFKIQSLTQYEYNRFNETYGHK